jgi:hypothetical protein
LISIKSATVYEPVTVTLSPYVTPFNAAAKSFAFPVKAIGLVTIKSPSVIALIAFKSANL